ncbi:MAG: hypothetical protein L6420_07960 [Elusimicrobia bacterium]|nr:hypothetical protein [Elusimicrobiota bacterium]
MLQRDSDTEQQKTARQRYRTTENSATARQRGSDTEQQKIARQRYSAAAVAKFCFLLAYNYNKKPRAMG